MGFGPLAPCMYILYCTIIPELHFNKRRRKSFQSLPPSPGQISTPHCRLPPFIVSRLADHDQPAEEAASHGKIPISILPPFSSYKQAAPWLGPAGQFLCLNPVSQSIILPLKLTNHDLDCLVILASES